MKKSTLILTIIFCISSYAFSQQLGQNLVGGHIVVSTNVLKVDAYKETVTDISLTPIWGYMITDKTAVGLAVSYNHSKKSSNDDAYINPYNINTLSIIPFFRFHGNISEKFKSFVEPSFGMTFALDKDESEHKTQIFNAGINVGVLYFISEKLSIELYIAGLNYVHTADKDTDIKTDDLNLSYSLLDPNLGLRYYF